MEITVVDRFKVFCQISRQPARITILRLISAGGHELLARAKALFPPRSPLSLGGIKPHQNRPALRTKSLTEKAQRKESRKVKRMKRASAAAMKRSYG